MTKKEFYEAYSAAGIGSGDAGGRSSCGIIVISRTNEDNDTWTLTPVTP